MYRIFYILAALTAAALAGCSGVPGHVIPQKEMAQLLADLYVGDAVVDEGQAAFVTDSSRQALKQSIYARHEVTPELVDTSLDWYGMHIDKYMEVCTMTEELLQQRIDQAEQAGTRTHRAQQQVAVDGDSVNVWPGVRFRRVNAGQPSDFIMFALHSDRNWERGDRYNLQVKGIDTRSTLRLDLGVDYNDGTTEFRTVEVPGQGMHHLVLVLDSAKVAGDIFGSIHYRPAEGEVAYLDSIALVRTRSRGINKEARQGQTVVTVR